MEPDDFAFVFIDLETTGLYPEAGVILEVGVVLASIDLDVINEKSWLVADTGWFYSVQDSNTVFEMHSKNGLIDDITTAHGKTGIFQHRREVAWSIQDFLHGNGFEDEVMPMCGSSVHFDRAWLDEIMPEISSMFTYRNIDVSSLKELAKIWFPSEYNEWSNTRPKSASSHRVLSDIHDTIDELRYYRQVMKL